MPCDPTSANGTARLPKQMLFGELLTANPFHGPKLCWSDEILRDIERIGSVV